ncbi:MAG: hypothetical protein WBJ81_05675 [Rickettsiales bacterium]
MKKLQHLGEYLLVRLWLAILACLPLKWASFITSKIFIFVGRIIKASKIADQNLQMVFPKLNITQRKEIITQVWSNLGYMVAEIPYLLALPKEKFDKYVILKGEEHIKPFVGKRIIICGAHLANWELIGKTIAHCNSKLSAVYREANNKLVNKLVNDLRETGVDGKLIPKGTLGAKLIIKALQNDEIVCMLLDQRMDAGIKVPFLGHDAMTASAAADLSIKYECPIIPIQVIRYDNSNFEVVVHPAVEFKNRSAKEIMLEVNNLMGEWIKANPGQWFWLHRRWLIRKANKL